VVVLIQRSGGSSVELDRPRGLCERPIGLAQPVGSVTRIKVEGPVVDNRMLGRALNGSGHRETARGLESRPTAVVREVEDHASNLPIGLRRSVGVRVPCVWICIRLRRERRGTQ
jgi:hypothetical protein